MERPMKPFGSAYNLTIVDVPLDRSPYTRQPLGHLGKLGQCDTVGCLVTRRVQ
jgi:hypothetical protein